MYDRLAGVKRHERKMLSKQATLNKEPLVKRWFKRWRILRRISY